MLLGHGDARPVDEHDARRRIPDEPVEQALVATMVDIEVDDRLRQRQRGEGAHMGKHR